MNDLRIASIRALADVGGSFLEVAGKVVLRHARRFSDHANLPEPMLELDEASIRFHGTGPAPIWETVDNISLSRDRIVVLVPHEESESISNPALKAPGRDVRIKLVCNGLQLTGFLRVPVQSTTAGFLHDATARFLPIGNARLDPAAGWGTLEPADLVPNFCLINRQMITACIESRSLNLPGLE